MIACMLLVTGKYRVDCANSAASEKSSAQDYKQSDTSLCPEVGKAFGAESSSDIVSDVHNRQLMDKYVRATIEGYCHQAVTASSTQICLIWPG